MRVPAFPLREERDTHEPDTPLFRNKYKEA